MQKRTNKEHHLYWLIFLMESWTYLHTKALILGNRKFSAASFYMDSPLPKGGGRLRSGGFRLGEKVAQTFNSELETKFAFLNGTLLIWHQSMHAKQLRWAFFIFVNDCIVTSGECCVVKKYFLKLSPVIKWKSSQVLCCDGLGLKSMYLHWC